MAFKGLTVDVYRDSSLSADCTNGGVTSQKNSFVLVGVEGPVIEENEENCLVLCCKTSDSGRFVNTPFRSTIELKYPESNG
jgi:hypothetical protein